MSTHEAKPPTAQPLALLLVRSIGGFIALAAGVVLILQEEREVGIGLIVAGVAGFGLTAKVGRAK